MSTWQVTHRLTGEVVYAYTADEPVEKARTDRAAADRVAGELLDTVATLRELLADASREAAVAAAATCGKLLGACAAEYRSVGEAAQGHAIDVETLMRA